MLALGPIPPRAGRVDGCQPGFAGQFQSVLGLGAGGSPGRPHFSDTALSTPSSCTSVQSLSGLYSFIARAIREVFAPRLR